MRIRLRHFKANNYASVKFEQVKSLLLVGMLFIFLGFIISNIVNIAIAVFIFGLAILTVVVSITLAKNTLSKYGKK